MKIKQIVVQCKQDISINLEFTPDLILCFTSLHEDIVQPCLIKLKEKYPHAVFAGCSSGGDIIDTNILYNTLSLTLIKFETSKVDVKLTSLKSIHDASINITNALNEEHLKHLLVFTDLQSNSFNFIGNLQKQIPKHIKVSGGVAGANQFVKNNNTYIIYQGKTYKDSAVFVGFYGKDLSIHCGSHAGWDSFGIERMVTKASGNILYELNGEKALDIYKRNLDKLGEKLPESAIKYPISVRISEHERPIIRTVIAINETDKSIELAGDIPLLSSVKLMKANPDRIILGAQKSAEHSINQENKSPQLAILVSCIGRQVILDQLINEELEVVRETFGEHCYLSGFYSYGEFAPISKTCQGVLHNQTMTITTIRE